MASDAVDNWQERCEKSDRMDIRIGQAERVRRLSVVAVMFSITTAVLMLLSAFNALADTFTLEHLDGETTPSETQSGEDLSESTSDLTGYTGELGEGAPSGYIRPHETRSFYDPKEPIVRPVDTTPSTFSEDSGILTYRNHFGVYSFQKSEASVLRFSDFSGDILAHARFSVLCEGEVVLGKAELCVSNSTFMVACQPVILDQAFIGNLTVTTEFFDQKPPKMSASIACSPEIDKSQLSIAWNLIIPDSEVKVSDLRIDASCLTSALNPGDSLTSLELGETDQLGSWTSRCLVDWSDAESGVLTLTRVGDAIVANILFPQGITLVDPTIVGTTFTQWATPGPTFRNIVYRDGIWWVFYYGSYEWPSGIWYRSSTDNGLTWSNSVRVPGTPILQDGRPSFDVAQAGSEIALCWAANFTGNYTDPDKYYLEFLSGTIGAGGITWDQICTICLLNKTSGEWHGGLALAADGTAYVARQSTWTIDYWPSGEGNRSRVVTYKKSSIENSFTEFPNPFDGAYSPAYPLNGILSLVPVFVARSDGSVMLIVDFSDPTSGNDRLMWSTYVPNVMSWEPNTDTYSCWHEQLENPGTFSVCADALGNSHVAFWTSNNHVGYARLSPDGSAVKTVFGFQAKWPSISLDYSDALHIVFASYGNASVNEIRSGPGDPSWSFRQLFDCEIGISGVSTSERFESLECLSYTENSTTPKRVMFASLPLPADVTGPFGDPWNAAGVNQDQPFSTSLCDSISPGNGLLYVFETDFVIPGRQTDLVVSRFFATPQYFVSDPSSGSYIPYLYDKFPFCELGDGWQLNLPWIDSTYVHLWGGVKIAIEWDGIVFNNTRGPQFTLTKTSNGFTLDLTDGMRVNFSSDGSPTGIFPNRLLNTYPEILLEYDLQGQLTRIEDYLCRKVFFNYTEGLLRTIEYSGNNVSFAYSGERLESTTDPIGRTTLFTYYDEENPSLLIQAITLPTGGDYRYCYETIQLGTEAIGKVVSRRDDEGRSTIYSYTAVEGVITYAQIDDYDSIPRQRWMGATEYLFDSKVKNTVVTYLGWNSSIGSIVTLKRTVSWYSVDGRVSRAETYSDFRSEPQSVVSGLDSRGNTIYSRDPTGHETFSSYAGTSTSNSFYRPANLDLATPGKLLHDDFNDWVKDGWTGGGGGYSTIGNHLQNSSLDPSLGVFSDGGLHYESIPISGDGGAVSELVLDLLVMVPTIYDSTIFWLLDSENAILAGIRMNYGSFKFWDDYWRATFVEYSVNTTYRLTLQMDDRDYYTRIQFFVDGVEIDRTDYFYMPPAQTFRVDVQTTEFMPVIIDNVKIFSSWAVSVEGVEVGKFVELYDVAGRVIGRAKATGPAVTISYSPVNVTMPYGNLVVRSKTGVVELADTYREIWGGDVFQYSSPSYLRCAVDRSVSGFESGNVIMDDSIPAGMEPFGTYLNETNPDFCMSGSQFHHGGYAPANTSHGYRPINQETFPAGLHEVGADSFMMQYVYLPSAAYPSMVGLQYFFMWLDTSGWHHEWSTLAYWGAGAIEGERMGDMPLPGQWILLIVKTVDVDIPQGSFYYGPYVAGVQFHHFGGDAYWDRSMYTTDPDFGNITFPDLLPSSASITLKKPDGSVIQSGSLHHGMYDIKLDVYSAGVRSFPLVAYFTMLRLAAPVPTNSPVFRDICAGDSYVLSSTPFYSDNPHIPLAFSKLAIGTMQYLDSGTTESMESYMLYDWRAPWILRESKAVHGPENLTTGYQYDEFANVVKVTDPTGATLNYTYSSLGTYLASSWLIVGSQNISEEFEYYPNGLLKNTTDSQGGTTGYEYDQVGRVIRTIYPENGGEYVSVRYLYDDVNNTETFYDQNGSVQVTGYDAYGRVWYVERWDKSGTPSSGRQYTYEWNGKIASVKDYSSSRKTISFEYDYLGRTTKTWNADGSNRTTLYDDKDSRAITFDEIGLRKDFRYDANDRLIQSIQYLGSSRLYTNMTYDGIGSVLNVTDCRGVVTRHTYDDLGRLHRITSPDGAYQEFQYDDASRLLQKRLEDGVIVYYSYDIAGRLLSWSTYDSSVDYSYDSSGSILVASRNQNGVTVTTARDYDCWGRVLNETTTIDGVSYTVSYSYDNRSNVVSVNVRDGMFRMNQSYDEYGRLTKVDDSTGATSIDVAEFLYDNADQLTSVQYGNGVTTNYTIDTERGWVTGIETKRGDVNLLALDYDRDASGRITSVNAGRSFVYDPLGRLAYANDTSIFGRLAYAYDLIGNRLNQTWGSIATSYSYDQWGRLLSNTTGSLTTTYQYWPTGTLKTKNAGGVYWNFWYDSNNLLVEVATGKKKQTVVEEYVYDAFSRRVKSTENGVTEYTIYSGPSPIYTLDPGTSTSTYHVYANGMHTAKKIGADYYYYHEDALGSVRLVTKNSDPTPWFQTDYLPFGAPFGSLPSPDAERYKFLDSSTTSKSKLMHFGARYYDSGLGRFISADSVMGSPSNSNSLNRWSYCVNDPINRVDVDGEFSFFKKISNFVSSAYNTVTNLVGDAIQVVVDLAVALAEYAVNVAKKVVDTAQKVIDDVKDAAAAVADAIGAGLTAVKEAWDNLDSGLKQWLITGVSFAVSLIPLVGPLISCVIDGTFVDMWNAIKSGDWGALALCAMAFVPGGKALKGFKAVGVLGKAEKTGKKHVDVYRYVNQKGLDKALDSGKIGPGGRKGIYVTTYRTGSASDALSKVTPLSSDVPVARLHGRICLDDYKFGSLTERDIVDPDITQYLLHDGPSVKLLDWFPLGP